MRGFFIRSLLKIVRCHDELVQPVALPAQILRQAQDDKALYQTISSPAF